MDAQKLYAWVISVLESEGSIDEAHLRTKVDAEDLDHILFLLNYMVSKGYIKAEIVGSSTKYFANEISEIKKTLQQVAVPSSSATDGEVRESLVVSVPISLTDAFESVKRNHQIPVLFLKDAIKLLLSKAHEEVLIASPFIEWDGLVYIADEIMKVAKNGASLKLITRDVINAKSDNYSYVSKLKAISKLHNLYVSNRTRPDRTFSIKDFGLEISGLGRTSMHYEGIHQKMVVVDRKYAYIGSGEIRAASLMTNGEAGHLVLGNQAAFWADFFDIFWRAAKEVPSEYLKY